MSSLGIEFPKEQERVRELLTEYQKIAATTPIVQISVNVIQQTLAKAEKAAISGDVIKMLAAYEELKNVN